jgi:hypothetical protein
MRFQPTNDQEHAKSIKEVPKFWKVANICNITWGALVSYVMLNSLACALHSRWTPDFCLFYELGVSYIIGR